MDMEGPTGVPTVSFGGHVPDPKAVHGDQPPCIMLGCAIMHASSIHMPASWHVAMLLSCKLSAFNHELYLDTRCGALASTLWVRMRSWTTTPRLMTASTGCSWTGLASGS